MRYGDGGPELEVEAIPTGSSADAALGIGGVPRRASSSMAQLLR